MYDVYKMYKVCKVYKVLLPSGPQASYPTSVGFIGNPLCGFRGYLQWFSQLENIGNETSRKRK